MSLPLFLLFSFLLFSGKEMFLGRTDCLCNLRLLLVVFQTLIIGFTLTVSLIAAQSWRVSKSVWDLLPVKTKMVSKKTACCYFLSFFLFDKISLHTPNPGQLGPYHHALHVPVLCARVLTLWGAQCCGVLLTLLSRAVSIDAPTS